MYKVSETVLPIYINGQCPIIKTCSDVTLNSYIVRIVFMFSHKINNTAYIVVIFSYISCIIVTLHFPVHCVTNNAFIKLYQPNFKMHDVYVRR